MKYWICKCGSINDDIDIQCRNCGQSPLITLYLFVWFTNEEHMHDWIIKAKKYMGAKVFRMEKKK